MITIDQTIEALNKAVEEKGADYVYPIGQPGFSNATNGCLYKSPDDSSVPLCIVGNVLNQFGFLKQAEEGTSAEGLYVIQTEFDEESLYLLDLAQSSQDSGRAWGEAAKYAQETYTKY